MVAVAAGRMFLAKRPHMPKSGMMFLRRTPFCGGTCRMRVGHCGLFQPRTRGHQRFTFRRYSS